MSKAIFAAIPIKPFGVAKARLAGRLGAADRSRLGKAVAARTAAAATDAGALVAVVTGDAGVAHWARSHGYLTVDEGPPSGRGLNWAAEIAVAEAARRQRCWAVIHADLPLVIPGALGEVFAAAERGAVVVPSHDGGTNIIAGNGVAAHFSYGTASFHRHLAMRPHSTIINRADLALDLDTAADLERAIELPAGRWLLEYVR